MSQELVTTRGQQALRYIWLSIIAAIATIALKFIAWRLSGSVGLLSDALESLVNLAGAVFALAMINVARVPPDAEHPFGHNKAEYFSSGFEGTLIFLAATAILFEAVPRLMHPQALESSIGLGLWFSIASTIINFVVARVLKTASRRLRSVALEADSRHLMTDVWTSVGVVVGLLGVMLTGWLWLDSVIAICVAAHILLEGWRLMHGSVDGLMDLALPADEIARIEKVMNDFAARGVCYAHLITRRAGSQRFVHLNILVPGDWQVSHAHDLLDEIEAQISDTLHGANVTTHLEPLERLG